jgi:hypothetical protein
MKEINEVVFRTSGGDWYVDGPNGELPIGTLRTAPHFVVTTPSGTQVFPDSTSTVTIHGEERNLAELEYILFVPATIIGPGFSMFVDGGSETVANPVIGDAENSSRPQSWTLNPDWISDDTGNAGLFAMIDQIAGVTDPKQRRSDERWVSLAEYFQGYFAKFHRSYATVFDTAPPFPSFLVIALDDREGPMIVEDGAVLGVTYEPDPADFTIDGDTLDITATPVLKFQTTVVSAGP